MRKFFSLCAACLVSLASYASDFGVGVNVGAATKSGMSTGMVGVKGLIGLPLKLALAPSVNYWFPKDVGVQTVNYWDLNVDVHYNLLHVGPLKVYPLVGVNYSHWSLKDTDLSDGQVAANVGAGAQVKFLPMLGASIEAKALIGDNITQFIPAATLYLMF